MDGWNSIESLEINLCICDQLILNKVASQERTVFSKNGAEIMYKQMPPPPPKKKQFSLDPVMDKP